jgi:KaiC/GvpD/RAD55 family RecA-like ATPase
MSGQKKFDPDGVDLSVGEQDQVINLMIFDNDFIHRCKRKGVDPDLFTSETRQNVVRYTFEYFEKYNQAPDINIADLLSTSSNGLLTRIREEDIPAVGEYLGRIVEMGDNSANRSRLYDKLSSFVNKRIIHTTISKLNKAKDRIDGSPEALREIVDDASRRLSISSTMGSTLGLYDEDDFTDEPWLTRFNIEPIDQAYGGGLTAPNLVILQGFTGRGKTWSVCHLAKIGMRLGNDAICCVTEMNAKKFLGRMRQSLTGMSWREYKEDKFKAWEVMKKSQVKGSELHLVSDQVKLDKDFRVDMLEGIVDEIEEKRKREQKLILIDSPDDMEPPEGTMSRTAIDKSKAVYTWLRNYSQERNKLVIVTSQSQRRSETLLWTTSGNIGDDLNKVRRATLGISINGLKSEVEAGYIRLLVFKNTYGPEMKAAWVETDFDNGMFCKQCGEIKGFSMDEYKKKLLAVGVTLSNKMS